MIKDEIAVIMTALGVHTIEELKNVSLVISGDTHHWLDQRGIDTKTFARRRKN